MEEFVLLFRLDIITKEAQPSPEQLQGYMKLYQDWVGGIAAQNKFVGGTGLSTEGKVLKFNNVMTDGPFAEIKESIAGFIQIKATDFDDAVAIAKACPILGGEGNSVEVRKIISVHEKK
jgi:hypothetical protein